MHVLSSTYVSKCLDLYGDFCMFRHVHTNKRIWEELVFRVGFTDRLPVN